MTKTQIQDAANIDRVRKLRASGHSFEFRTARTRKGTIAVSITAWHRNDTRRLVPFGFYCASFYGQASADAYIEQMKTA